MNIIFQYYSEVMVNKFNKLTNAMMQVKEGFTNIPLEDKWSNLSKEDKMAIVVKADRLIVKNSLNPEADVTRLQSFADQIGFKGTANVGGKDKDYVYVNRRPSPDTSFDSLANDPDLADITSELGFGSR
tara:strand:- start:1763 stop:2149 length:387 start_codon:yes stop_codon:yes gene_type:complete